MENGEQKSKLLGPKIPGSPMLIISISWALMSPVQAAEMALIMRAHLSVPLVIMSMIFLAAVTRLVVQALTMAIIRLMMMTSLAMWLITLEIPTPNCASMCMASTIPTPEVIFSIISLTIMLAAGLIYGMPRQPRWLTIISRLAIKNMELALEQTQTILTAFLEITSLSLITSVSIMRVWE